MQQWKKYIYKNLVTQLDSDICNGSEWLWRPDDQDLTDKDRGRMKKAIELIKQKFQNISS